MAARAPTSLRLAVGTLRRQGRSASKSSVTAFRADGGLHLFDGLPSLEDLTGAAAGWLHGRARRVSYGTILAADGPANGVQTHQAGWSWMAWDVDRTSRP